LKAAQPLIPENRRNDSWGHVLAATHVHAFVAANLYSGERLAVSLNFRSARDSFSQTSRSLFTDNAVPFGFCSGGFSSTAGYVPGNEA